MTSLAPLPSSVLRAWGEPTVTLSARCTTPFTRDGASVGEIERYPGGSAYTTAVVAALCGIDVEFHGPFAMDEPGLWMLAAAQRSGVTVVPVAARRSRHTVDVIDLDGSRSVVNDLRDQFCDPYASTVSFDTPGLLHISVSSLQRDMTGATWEMLARHRDLCVLSVDAGSVQALEAWGPDRMTALLEQFQVSVLFANESEAEHLQRSLGSKVLDRLPLMVVKRGPHPTEVYTSGTLQRFAVDAVAAVDSTGAGDSFAAGFLAAWCSGRSLEVAVVLAQAVSKVCVETRGTLPDADGVRACASRLLR
jgi:sugar/nucleoside kinase (ribokinase family)